MRAIITAVWAYDVESVEEAEEIRRQVDASVIENLAAGKKELGLEPDDPAVDYVGSAVTVQ